MNIFLPTNDDNRLGFHGVQRYSDNSGFCANLVVRCYGFSGEMLFCVEPHPFVAFVEALEAMDRSLTGRARLKPVYEEPYVELELDRLGRVMVTGELISTASHRQKLWFEFGTDQTVLAPFARDLRSCISMRAT